MRFRIERRRSRGARGEVWRVPPASEDVGASLGQEFQMAELSPLRRRMIADTTVRNMAPSTRRSDIGAVSKLSRYSGKSPERLDLEDVRAF